uniref:Nicotinamide nucleotide adenylyltransferase 3 n=1 Tax=Bos mutus grunniens TaxID=30521 RepID=A0A8C0A2D6_BOSMU
MPVDFTGYWKMLANENFEEYLRALDVNVALRKIANLLKPDKEIVQEGDHMIIRTLSTFRNYIMDFQVGKEFEEDLTGIDDRKCMPRPEGAAVEEGSKPPVNKDGKLVTWRPQLVPPRCLRKVSLGPPSTFWGSLGGQGAVCLALTVVGPDLGACLAS